MMVRALEQIQKKKEGYFQMYTIDCAEEGMDQELPYCTADNRAKLPALLFTKPALNNKDEATGKVNEAEMISYQGALDEKSLYTFMSPLLRTFSRELKTEKDLRRFQMDFPNTPRVIYYTNK